MSSSVQKLANRFQPNSPIESLVYRTHLTSFPVIPGFEVSRHSAINELACPAKPFSAIRWRNPASCKASAFRIRSQMGSIANILQAKRQSEDLTYSPLWVRGLNEICADKREILLRTK
jgi:hypothetical protein